MIQVIEFINWFYWIFPYSLTTVSLRKYTYLIVDWTGSHGVCENDLIVILIQKGAQYFADNQPNSCDDIRRVFASVTSHYKIKMISYRLEGLAYCGHHDGLVFHCKPLQNIQIEEQFHIIFNPSLCINYILCLQQLNVYNK